MKHESKQNATNKGIIYRILALYMPLAVLTMFVLLLSKIFVFISVLPLLAGIYASALAVLIYYFANNQDASHDGAVSVFALLIAAAVVYLACSLFNIQAGIKECFMPSVNNVLPSFASLYIWITVNALLYFFAARRRFESYTSMYQGETLTKVLEKDPGLLRFMGKRTAFTGRSYLFQLVIVGLTLIAVLFMGIEISPVLYIASLVVLVSGICIYGFIEIMRREYYFVKEGITISVFDRYKHILAMGVFFLLAVTVAMVFMPDSKSAFSVGTSNVFDRLPFFAENTEQPVGQDAPKVSFWAANGNGSFVFIDIIQFVFIAFVVFGFLGLILLPLISRKSFLSGEMPAGKNPVETLIEWIKRILAMVKGMFFIFALKRPQKNLSAPITDIRKTVNNVLAAYSMEKKQDIKQSVTLFARLIVWGNEVRHVKWKPSHAPGEYCSLLADGLQHGNQFSIILLRSTQLWKAGECPPINNFLTIRRALARPYTEKNEELLSKTPRNSVPSVVKKQKLNSVDMQADGPLAADIIRCGDLFEKAIYSARPLTETERNEFKLLVEGIIGSRKTF